VTVSTHVIIMSNLNVTLSLNSSAKLIIIIITVDLYSAVFVRNLKGAQKLLSICLCCFTTFIDESPPYIVK